MTRSFRLLIGLASLLVMTALYIATPSFASMPNLAEVGQIAQVSPASPISYLPAGASTTTGLSPTTVAKVIAFSVFLILLLSSLFVARSEVRGTPSTNVFSRRYRC